jgi:hypothetical protein
MPMVHGALSHGLLVTCLVPTSQMTRGFGLCSMLQNTPVRQCPTHLTLSP